MYSVNLSVQEDEGGFEEVSTLPAVFFLFLLFACGKRAFYGVCFAFGLAKRSRVVVGRGQPGSGDKGVL